MKKLILIAAVALMALPAAAQVQEAFPSYIQVNGRAEKEITPDEFYLSVIINERDSKGKISVESQQRDMIAALKRLGVNVEKQLKVANLSSEFFKKNTSTGLPLAAGVGGRGLEGVAGVGQPGDFERLDPEGVAFEDRPV